LKNSKNLVNFSWKAKVQFATGPQPTPALTCPDTPELAGPRRLPSIHSYSYGFQSSPAFSRICPASVSRMTSSGILMQYAG